MRLSGLCLSLIPIAALGSRALLAGSDLLPAQTVDRPALERDLAQARARWNASRPANYEYVLNIPTVESPWTRRFGSFRVSAGSSATIAPLTGSMAHLFQGRTTIEALFDLVGERIATSSASVSLGYDDELGYVNYLFNNRDYDVVSFEIPVWRAFIDAADVREPFALVHHVNHCGMVAGDRRSLSQCPEYSIAMWGDGTVVYLGRAGVRTLGRRQHRADQNAVRELSRAIADSGFFEMADDYRSVTSGLGQVVTIDHAAEKWVTIRADGRQKTVHDFHGAPQALERLEAVIERAANSQRYTGRSDTGR